MRKGIFGMVAGREQKVQGEEQNSIIYGQGRIWGRAKMATALDLKK